MLIRYRSSYPIADVSNGCAARRYQTVSHRNQTLQKEFGDYRRENGADRIDRVPSPQNETGEAIGLPGSEESSSKA